MLIPITSGWLSRLDKEERKARKRLKAVIKEIAKFEEKTRWQVHDSQYVEELYQELHEAEANFYKILEHKDQLIDVAYKNLEQLILWMEE